MTTETITLIEHYPGCPCGTCQEIRQVAHNERWAQLSIIDRVQETLNAKIEADFDRMPEKGMFVCRDIAALLDLARSQS